MFKQCLMVSVLAATLCSCSNGNGPDHKYEENGYSRNLLQSVDFDRDYSEFDVRVKLAEVAQSVSDSLNEMVRVEKSVNPQPRLSAPLNPAKINMSQSVNFRLERACRTTAKKSG